MSSSPSDSSTTPLPAEGLRVYLKPRVIGMLFLGFSAGLPLLLVGGTFSAWLRGVVTARRAMGVHVAVIRFTRLTVSKGCPPAQERSWRPRWPPLLVSGISGTSWELYLTIHPLTH